MVATNQKLIVEFSEMWIYWSNCLKLQWGKSSQYMSEKKLVVSEITWLFYWYRSQSISQNHFPDLGSCYEFRSLKSIIIIVISCYEHPTAFFTATIPWKSKSRFWIELIQEIVNNHAWLIGLQPIGLGMHCGLFSFKLCRLPCKGYWSCHEHIVQGLTRMWIFFVNLVLAG